MVTVHKEDSDFPTSMAKGNVGSGVRSLAVPIRVRVLRGGGASLGKGSWKDGDCRVGAVSSRAQWGLRHIFSLPGRTTWFGSFSPHLIIGGEVADGRP